MKTFQAKVYVQNGNARLPHTVQLNAQSSFSAQQMLIAQYGLNNVLTIPVEVGGSGNSRNAPWMISI